MIEGPISRIHTKVRDRGEIYVYETVAELKAMRNVALAANDTMTITAHQGDKKTIELDPKLITLIEPA